MIEARGLTKRYGDRLAVSDLTFSVRPGKVTGFLGPNGAGKSTTIRMIMGLDLPTAGTATIDGRPYRSLRHPMRHVGALLDARAVHPGRSAYPHLLALAQSNRLPRGRVDEVLDMVGLAGVGWQRSGRFSLGMSQRLGIAAALLGDPPVLIFDEPVNGLDPEGIRWVRDLMRSLADQGRTVLVSSHLMSEMALTADDLIVIGAGRLITHTSVEEFVAGNAASYVRVRTPVPEQLARELRGAGADVLPEDDVPGEGGLRVTGLSIEDVGELAAKHGLPLHELTPRHGSLEDAYLHMTGSAVEYRSGMPVHVPQQRGDA